MAGAFPILASASDCFEQAGRYHSVNANILRAIAIRENVKCDGTIRLNKNKSFDTGCMQINSVHLDELSKYGVTHQDLLDPCKNIFVGAWHLSKKIKRHGNTWKAIGAYHSENPELRDQYAIDVYQIWIRYGLNK